MPFLHRWSWGVVIETIWLADLQTLAKTLNFSRAAKLRNITQPAFGRRIKSLEDWSGGALVDRSTHRLKLTPAGEILLAVAHDVVGRLERAQHELYQTRNATGTLTFAATHALSFTFLPSWIQGLGSATTAPVRLLSDNMNACEKILQRGDAQFLLCHYHPNSRISLAAADFEHIELAADRLIPVSGKDRAGRALYRLPGSVAAPVPCLSFEKTSGMGRILASNLLETTNDLQLSTVFTSHLAMVLKALAADGKGVAWIPQSLAVDETGPGGRLTGAGTDEWAVDVQIVLFRSRAKMNEIGEQFWQLARQQQG